MQKTKYPDIYLVEEVLRKKGDKVYSVPTSYRVRIVVIERSAMSWDRNVVTAELKEKMLCVLNSGGR